MTLRTRDVDGFVLSAREIERGAAGAPLLVLVHGMMEPADVWLPVARPLARELGLRCVALGLPWNGEQGGLWGQTRGPVCWLQRALDEFELAPDAWLAHSFGASTLLGLLSRSGPEQQRPAVLVSPFFKSCHTQVTWPLFERYVAEFIDFVRLSVRIRLGSRMVDAQVLERMTQSARDSFGCYVWMQFWQLFSAMPFLALERLQQPVLTLTGADDFSTPLEDVQALHRKLPQGQLVVYGAASHFLLASRRADVTRATARFLSTHLGLEPRPAAAPVPAECRAAWA
jgi:pimeloyl-ACP methyl ester carboxylesterase